MSDRRFVGLVFVGRGHKQDVEVVPGDSAIAYLGSSAFLERHRGGGRLVVELASLSLLGSLESATGMLAMEAMGPGQASEAIGQLTRAIECLTTPTIVNHRAADLVDADFEPAPVPAAGACPHCGFKK